MIDVCLVTKNDVKTIKGLEYIPFNKLIIEKSIPLGLARKISIQKVTTGWFAFIDDDVKIDEGWFKTLSGYMEDPKIGAIQGMLDITGLGEEWDKALNKSNKKIRFLKLGERGFTHNTLIKTELVKDWDPPSDISAWEDYLLTQHILKKGYKWIIIPTQSKHEKTWNGIRKKAIWGIKGRKKIFPSKKDSLKQLIKYSIWITRSFFSINIPWKVKIYRTYLSLSIMKTHIDYLVGNFNSRARS